MKKLFWFVISTIVLLSCAEKNPVVLTINDFTLTKSELKQYLTREKNRIETNQKSKFTEQKLNNWLDYFVETKLLEQAAREKGYDENPDALYAASVFKKFLIAKKHGKFYEEFIDKKVKVESEDVARGMNYCLYNYSFEVISIPSLDSLVIMEVDTSNIDEKAYDQIKQHVSINGLQFDTVKSAWPFFELLGNMHVLEQMEVNQISSPLIKYNNPYKQESIIVKLLSKERNARKKEEIKSEEVGHNLYLYGTNLIFHQSLYDCYRETGLTIDDEIITACYDSLKYKEGSSEIDEKSLTPFSNQIILTYNIQNSNNSITVADFVEFFNNIPMKRKFTSFSDYREYIMDMVVQDYFWYKAEEIGLLEDDEIKRQNQAIDNNYIISEYIQNELYDTIKVTSDDVKERYQKDKQHFSFPATIHYDILLFKNYNDAYLSYNKLSTSSIEITDSVYKDDMLITNLIDIQKGNEISGDSLVLNNRNIRHLISLKDSKFSQVFPYSNNYAFAVKTGEDGVYTIPFDEIKDKLKISMNSELKQQTRDSYLADLKVNSNIKYDIKLSEYFVN